MATLVFCCGAECGVVAANTAPPSPAVPHWNTVTNVTISTSTVRPGSTKSYTASTTNALIQHNFAAGTQRVVGRFYVNFSALPGSGTQNTFASLPCSVGGAFFYYNQSSGRIEFGIGAGTTRATSVITTGVWYRIDFDFNTTANPQTLNVSLDGVPAALQATNAAAAIDIQGIRAIGALAASMTVFVEDIAISFTGADYPIGPGAVAGLHPLADGTHSFTLNDFLYNAAGGSIATNATDVHTYVDDPIDNTTDFINQAVIRTAGYVEVTLDPLVGLPVTKINGVEAVYGYHSASTTANTAAIKFNDNGTISDIQALSDWSESGLVSPSKHFAVAPSTSAAWTKARVDALRVRFGYSDDANPDAYWDAFCAEVDYVPAVGLHLSNPILQAVKRAVNW